MNIELQKLNIVMNSNKQKRMRRENGSGYISQQNTRNGKLVNCKWDPSVSIKCACKDLTFDF